MIPINLSLCRFDEFPDGDSRGFDPMQSGQDTMFVIRKGDALHAWRNACPHGGYQGSPMARRKDAYLNADRSRIMCFGHGAEFDIASGVCVAGACRGLSLTPVPVFVNHEGMMRLGDIGENL